MKKDSIEKESEKLIDITDIDKDAKEIYPEDKNSQKCDEQVNQLYKKINNWAEIFYYGKTNLIKERFLNIISKSEYSKFFEALDYEYGINGKSKDIKLAFEIYKQRADNSTDLLSMYKMYHIYKNEFNNFGFEKRNKILEKYYLFKCFAYLPKYQLDRNSFLLNRFNIPYEVKIIFYYEDKNRTKFDKLIKHLNKYKDYYSIKKDDLLIIESSISFEYNEEKKKSLELLNDLIKNNNLEAIFKAGIFNLKEENSKAEKFFELLIDKKYYRSFCDYAIYLYKEKKNSEKAIELLKMASQNGILRANYLYYDIFLSTIDFTKLEINNEFKNNLIILFNLLINDIVTDGVYSTFEYFYLRKLCIKHYNLKQFIESYFTSETKDFIKTLMDKTCQNLNTEEIEAKKEIIQGIYKRDVYFPEFHLCCGLLYYYGVEDIINIDLGKSLSKFQISYDNGESKSYKRFCYSYISKIKEKLNKKNPEYITGEENEKSKRLLFDLYNSSIEKDYIDILSPSFYYFLSRLYEKKWGNSGNELMEYICLKRASKNDNDRSTPGYGTIICYYRKYKSKINLKKKGNLYILKLKEIMQKNDSEGYGEDNSICPICIENKRNIMVLPCKHLFCSVCINKIMELSKCPICRQLILFNFDIDKMKKESEK